MIQKNIGRPSTTIRTKEQKEGETIEQKIERILNNNEPITDGAPIVYMERRDGVQPEYDIRSDRWDIALDAMDKVSKTKTAKREQRQKERDDKKSQTTSSTQGTEPSTNPAA